jgi:hypothetical protein
MKSILDYLDRIPPFMCRLIARKDGGIPMTTQEIVERSGLNVKTVNRLSKSRTFAEVTVRAADAFRVACGITPRNHAEQLRYIRATSKSGKPLRHVDKLPRRTKRLLAAVIERSVT